MTVTDLANLLEVAPIELVKKLINTENWGFEGEECVPLYTVFEKEYAQMDFSEVGIKVGDTPYELIVIQKVLTSENPF